MIGQFHTHSPEETEAIAGQLAQILVGGECIALEGDLGAGKTCFVRGLLHALGGNAREVTSPTFVLLNVYRSGRLVLYHLDAYRVGPSDFDDIGFSELLDQGGVVVVEWASRVAPLLPGRFILVEMTATDMNTRQLSIEQRG